MILQGRKKMEIRGAALSAGKYFLGMKKKIYGVVVLGQPRHISCSHEFRHLRPLHCVTGGKPYKKTYGLPIVDVRTVDPPISYEHPRGAIGIVTYR